MPEAENLDIEALWTEAATCNRKPKSAPEVRDWQIIASDARRKTQAAVPNDVSKLGDKMHYMRFISLPTVFS